jgi:hypothetical protein
LSGLAVVEAPASGRRGNGIPTAMSTTDTTRLTDTQLVILAQAAQRPNGCVLPLPSSLKAKGRAAATTLMSLHKRGLVIEHSACRDQEEWRHDDDGVRLTLLIAPAGLHALGLAPDPSLAEASGEEGEPDRMQVELPDPVGPAHDAVVNELPDSTAPSRMARQTGTKAAALIALIERDGGATLPELMAASGWQAHSVRGFLSGTLKRKLGRALVSETSEEGARRYRLPDEPG